MGNAWILDLKSRRVVWELSAATTERGRRSTRAFAGSVRLPAGTYEAFYSAFPNMYWTDEKGDTNTAQRFMNWLADEGFDEFRLTIRGGAQALAGADAERARREFETGAIVTLRGDGGREIPAGRLHPLPPDRARHLRRRRSARERRVRLRLDRQRRHAREDLEADVARFGARRRRREEPDGAHLEDAARRPLRRLLRDRRLARRERWNSAPPHDPQAWGLLDARARRRGQGRR